MIDLNLIPEYERQFWADHYGLCKVHPAKWAVAVHHEPPRSLNPYWKEQPETWYLVCNDCHERVHSMTRTEAVRYLNGR